MYKRKNSPIERKLSTDSIHSRYANARVNTPNTVQDFYIPSSACTTCQYRKETLISREIERVRHLPPPPDIKNKIREIRRIDSMQIEKIKDRFIFSYWWDKIFLGFISKQFRKPFKYIMYHSYYDKDVEFISIFNLYTEIIKKNKSYTYFMENVPKPSLSDTDKKKLMEELQTPITPPPLNSEGVTKDEKHFISFAKLEKQDKMIELIGDDI